MKSFEVPKSGQPLTILGRIVMAMATALNGLRNFRFEAGDDWGFQWDEGAAVFTYPSDLDNAGAGLGPVVFAGTASGEVAYFLINCDGTAYSSPPAGYTVANPD